jgi:ribosome-associated protein
VECSAGCSFPEKAGGRKRGERRILCTGYKIMLGRWSLDGLALARSLVRALEEKKAEEILLLDLQGKCSFADYFILCSGSSDRMLSALKEAVVETAHKEFRASARMEGRSDSGWVLVDLGVVITHILSPAMREYYNLEEFWKEARVVVRIQ